MAGFELNSDLSDYIHRRIQQYRRYPEEHFTGSDRTLNQPGGRSNVED
jgi:hypothetical protein